MSRLAEEMGGACGCIRRPAQYSMVLTMGAALLILVLPSQGATPLALLSVIIPSYGMAVCEDGHAFLP